jgi:hypothetical protein
MGLKGYRLWVMGQLDSTCSAPPSPPRRPGRARTPPGQSPPRQLVGLALLHVMLVGLALLHVMLQSKHKLMTVGSEGVARVGPCNTNLTPGSECNSTG